MVKLWNLNGLLEITLFSLKRVRVLKHHYNLFAKFLHDAREKSGLSQNKLGDLLGYHGQFVSNWERGIAAPPPKSFRKICEVLDISQGDFLRVVMKEQEIIWSSYFFNKKTSRR